MRRGASGQITVFISLIMMSMFALICVLLESARTAGARWYLQTAASSALDSVFSGYHRPLWDSYRLLFAQYQDIGDLEADFSEFLQAYLDAENWYLMELDSVSADKVLRAVDAQGLYFQQEVLDYMKYGMWKLDFDEKTAAGLWNGAREAAAVKDVAGIYRGHAAEALKLERALEQVSESLERQRERKQESVSRLRRYDGPGFRRKAQEWIRELERMPGLVEQYRKRADQLARGLEKSRREYEVRGGDCSSQVRQMLEQEIREYESYAALDGDRRREVESLEGKSRSQILSVESLIEEALRVERIIDEWEDDEEDGGGGPDLSALWRPVERRASALEISELSFAHGVKDKEKEGWLNRVQAMYQGGLLELVVPDGVSVSDKKVSLSGLPSAEQTGSGGRTIGFLDHLLVNEYCGEFFRNFCQRLDGSVDGKGGVKSEPGVPADTGSGIQNTALQYEAEYLIAGKASDRDNLSASVQRLLAIREGLNLIHIMSDAGKRAEARNLAMLITGAGAVTPLLMVTAFFIMSVWALGESLMDVRGLLAGKRIPLFKSPEDWTLGMEALLSMGQDRKVAAGGSEKGLGYLSWLKILLFMEDIVTQEYRMMDLMQLNLMQEEGGFRMSNGVYQVEIRGELWGKHVFFSLGFVEKLIGSDQHAYPMEILVQRVY